jgi:hypothetical protein
MSFINLGKFLATCLSEVYILLSVSFCCSNLWNIDFLMNFILPWTVFCILQLVYSTDNLWRLCPSSQHHLTHLNTFYFRYCTVQLWNSPPVDCSLIDYKSLIKLFILKIYFIHLFLSFLQCISYNYLNFNCVCSFFCFFLPLAVGSYFWICLAILIYCWSLLTTFSESSTFSSTRKMQ